MADRKSPPLDGVSILIKTSYAQSLNARFVRICCCESRQCNVIIINVHLPCSGTSDRLSIIDGVI